MGAQGELIYRALPSMPVRRLEIHLSQGAAWNALISQYIGAIPPSGAACCAAEQSMSAGAPGAAASSAMTAKVGAAARHSQSAAPRAKPLSTCLLRSAWANIGMPDIVASLIRALTSGPRAQAE